MCIPNNIIPIHWFGDRDAYENSKVKVITVCYNPSNMEFRENIRDPFSTELRFPHYQEGMQETMELAWNAYFEYNPYKKWFGAFENILNGMGASYYCDKKYPYRALHVDICSPWATVPTWSALPKTQQKELYVRDSPQQLVLISELKPQIIVASIKDEYIDKLGIANSKTEFKKFDFKKDDTKRKTPEVVYQYQYNGVPFINGIPCQTPFGRLSKKFQYDVGEEIRNRLLQSR